MTERPPSDVTSADLACSQCGAETAWDPGAQGLKCGTCGAVTKVDAPKARPGHTIQDASRRWPARPRRPGSLHIACRECGAVVDTAPGELTAACPFCGSEAVAEAEDDGRSFPPDAVVPFTITKEDARARYRAWLGRLWLRPSGLGRGAHLEGLSPVYVPVWSFDLDALTDWHSGVAGGGQVFNSYTGRLAQASTGLPEKLWRGVEPFPVDGARAYDGRFLAGFAAEAARVQPLTAWQNIRAEIEKRERYAAEAEVDRDIAQTVSAQTSFENVRFRQVLVPVYLAAYRYRGRAFRFLVNGATGAVQGRAPWSLAKVGAVAAILVLALVGAVGWMQSHATFQWVRIEHSNGYSGTPSAPARHEMSGAERARAYGLKPIGGNTGPVHVREFAPAQPPHRGAPSGRGPPGR